MPDRRRRAALLLPLPATAPGVVLLPRERKPSSPSPDSSQDADNPFAAPPAGAPDQAWRPRTPANSGNKGQGKGQGQDQGQGQEGDGTEDQPTWGSQWSSRQPGRQGGGFGSRPDDGQNDPSGQSGPGGGSGGGPGGLRWDPTDPAQRRARYALLSGLWAFFFAIFSLPEIALLLGALALYWGISSLRAKPRDAATAALNGTASAGTSTSAASGTTGSTGTSSTTGAAGSPGSTGPNGSGAAGSASPSSAKPQATAAIGGLVLSGIALAIVAATFAFQLVYRDYYTCVNDSLTQSSRQSCENLLPKQLRPLLSVQE